MKKRIDETCALRERRPPGRETDTRAHFRNGFSTRWSRGRCSTATGSRHRTSNDDCGIRTAGTSPCGEIGRIPICVYLCDLWALFVVGTLAAVAESGGAIQLASLSASICVICGFSWAGGCLCGCTNVRETESVLLTEAEIHHGFVRKIGDLSEGVGIEVFRLVIG